MPELRDLTLNHCTLVSLEPLAALPSLRILDLAEAVYPSLEPLTRSTVEYLELDRSVVGRETYDAANYEYFTQIPNLIYLDVVNHIAFDPQVCSTVLEGCPNLRYLNIWYTGAAEAIADGDYEPDTSRLEAFATKPSGG